MGGASTFGIVDHAVKVFDVTQAVAPKLQGVGCEAQAIVHDIKGALVLEGVAGVTIGYNDLHHGTAVHDWSHMAPILIPAGVIASYYNSNIHLSILTSRGGKSDSSPTVLSSAWTAAEL